VIGAEEGIGIAGIAPGARLIGVPICTPTPDPGGDVCLLYDVIRGLDDAWGARADILNLALAGPANLALERAVTRLDQLERLVVAAAANDGTDQPRYPAAYPSVIGVGAVDRNGEPFTLGNRGASAEMVAPGVEILSTVPGGSFAFSDGTSLATAHVSGVLALLVAAGSEPADARRAIFQAGFADPRARPERAVLTGVCDPLARLGRPCPSP
jgi:thermitase